MKQIYTGVDAAKYLMAFLVVLIHVLAVTGMKPPGAVDWLMQLAVPFFFISSGWFLGAKLQHLSAPDYRKVLLSRALALFKLFCLWMLIYLPAIALVYWRSRETFGLDSFIKDEALRVIVSGETYYTWPLWFLHSLVAGCVLLCAIGRKDKVRNMAYVLLMLLISVNWMHSEWQILPSALNKILSLRVFSGIAMFLTGIYAYKGWKYIAKGNMLINSILIGGGSALLFALQLPYSTLIGGMAVFMASMQYNSVSLPVAHYLRNQSMWIYYMHMYVLFVAFCLIGPHYNIEHLNLWQAYALALILTLAVTNVLGWLNNNTPLHRALNPLIR